MPELYFVGAARFDESCVITTRMPHPKGRLAVLQPGGIAEQIVRLKVPKYRERYDMEKARLIRERGLIEKVDENEGITGEANGNGTAELAHGSDLSNGRKGGDRSIHVLSAWATLAGPLRPIQVEKRARIIAAKAFVADLWRAWREILDSPRDVVGSTSSMASPDVDVGDRGEGVDVSEGERDPGSPRQTGGPLHF